MLNTKLRIDQSANITVYNIVFNIPQDYIYVQNSRKPITRQW